MVFDERRHLLFQFEHSLFHTVLFRIISCVSNMSKFERLVCLIASFSRSCERECVTAINAGSLNSGGCERLLSFTYQWCQKNK
jgi:hypothetical protein